MSKLIDTCCDHIRIAGDYTLLTEGEQNIEAYGDASRIEQVLINYVNNAIKYAPASKVIRIYIEREANKVRVSVIDQGPGVSPEKLPHLFDRYFRADTSGLQYSGLGLGLYINAEIIKKHGGEVGVESQLGQGSKFWFTLPYP